jgi:uncharacterized membrane protein YfcA
MDTNACDVRPCVMNFTHIVFVACVFVVAGGVKGMAGLGLPTVAMGLLSLVLTAAESASLLLLPSLVTNAWQAFSGGALGALSRRLAMLGVGIVAGTLFGAVPGFAPSPAAARGALGAVLIVYGAWGLMHPSFAIPPRHERWLAPLVGYITGVITSATGVFVVPTVPYLQSLRLTKEELVQALGLCFTLSTVALATHLKLTGQLDVTALSASAAALVPCVAGLWMGEKLRRRISDAAFRVCFFVALIALGCATLLLSQLR